VDSNLEALEGWDITPRIVDGKLVFDGVDKWDEPSKDGLRRWLKHNGRIQRIKMALITGEKCAR